MPHHSIAQEIVTAPTVRIAMTHGLSLLKQLYAPGALTIAFQPILG
jgi:hypothetical protein